MNLTRRSLLASAAGLPLLAAKTSPLAGLKIGVMDASLGLGAKIKAVETAARLGFDGVQVSIGAPGPDGHLWLSDKDLQAQYVASAKEHKIALDATYLDILHTNCLKSEEIAKQWVREGIEITRALNAKILMLVFFGKCAIKGEPELTAVSNALKELAPEARRANVILGFENLLNADDNLKVLDAVRSPALQVYYDIGNLTNTVGVDAPTEIRRLGKRICQFHFKDKGYLGEGKVDLAACLNAIADIGFTGFANLETSSPSKDIEADMKRNLEFTRKAISSIA
jgi:L-ribulose-5-phosphate 3-epimerase